MPLYEYWCPKCEIEFELMRRMDQLDDLASCPRCGEQTEKLVSAFASKTGSYIAAPARSVFRKLPKEAEPKPTRKRKK